LHQLHLSMPQKLLVLRTKYTYILQVINQIYSCNMIPDKLHLVSTSFKLDDAIRLLPHHGSKMATSSSTRAGGNTSRKRDQNKSTLLFCGKGVELEQTKVGFSGPRKKRDGSTRTIVCKYKNQAAWPLISHRNDSKSLSVLETEGSSELSCRGETSEEDRTPRTNKSSSSPQGWYHKQNRVEREARQPTFSLGSPGRIGRTNESSGGRTTLFETQTVRAGDQKGRPPPLLALEHQHGKTLPQSQDEPGHMQSTRRGREDTNHWEKQAPLPAARGFLPGH
jgi:hypothetical protein